MLPECEAVAEYFTDFTLENKDTYTVSNEYFSIDIPTYLSEKETFGKEGDSFTMYGTPDGAISCVLVNEPESYPMSMIEAYEEYDEEKVLEKYNITDVEKMFASLGYGSPDSFYNVMKTEDLNKPYTFIIRAREEGKTVDMNEVFGMLNSFQFIEQ